MNWLQIFQVVFSLLQQAGPILTAIGSLHTAINATPGTAEHTAAVESLNAIAKANIPTQ